MLKNVCVGEINPKRSLNSGNKEIPNKKIVKIFKSTM
jgi:hypothetical protein